MRRADSNHSRQQLPSDTYIEDTEQSSERHRQSVLEVDSSSPKVATHQNPDGPKRFSTLLLYTVLSSIGLAYFNVMYTLATHSDHGWMKRMRVSEDLYGRAFFFFLISIISYRYHVRINPGMSIFEIEASVRWIFALKMVLNILFLIFLGYSLKSTSNTSTALLFVSQALPWTRFIYHVAYTRSHWTQLVSFLILFPSNIVLIHGILLPNL